MVCENRLDFCGGPRGSPSGGPISRLKRARDWYLYTDDGRRLVDLWQAGGRALLGHKPANIVRELKNNAEKGLFAPFPSIYEGRLIKALRSIFPAEESAFRVYNKLPQEFSDIPIWRPFFDESAPFKMIEPPFRVLAPFPLAPEIVLVNVCPQDEAHIPPPSDIISPVIMATTVRALYDLLAAGRSNYRSKINYPRIDEALRAASSKWERNGIYISQKIRAETFARFLASGFLIPPKAGDPLILPPNLSAREEASLASLL